MFSVRSVPTSEFDPELWFDRIATVKRDRNLSMKEVIVRISFAATICTLFVMASFCSGYAQNRFHPGTVVTPDAHNCYPYEGRWSDRIDRALAGGTPAAIEQDLFWYRPDPSRSGRSVVAHGLPVDGSEPSMEHYFFERVRPLVEDALRNPDHSHWPIITLNLDIKTEEPEHLRAIRELLTKYQTWLTTTTRTSDASRVEKLMAGPILVLNGPSDAQQKIFYDEIPVGGKLLTFGAVHTDVHDLAAPATHIETENATNYRRWWNNSWTVIESEGQPHAMVWTPEKNARLKSFVAQAHARGLWIRFYTLDGANKTEQDANGWFGGYNFPSLEAARLRWIDCIRNGVDYLASDQYELVSALVRKMEVASPRKQ